MAKKGVEINTKRAVEGISLTFAGIILIVLYYLIQDIYRAYNPTASYYPIGIWLVMMVLWFIGGICIIVGIALFVYWLFSHATKILSVNSTVASIIFLGIGIILVILVYIVYLFA